MFRTRTVTLHSGPLFSITGITELTAKHLSLVWKGRASKQSLEPIPDSPSIHPNYRPEWTALLNRHTVRKQLVNWHFNLQVDLWICRLVVSAELVLGFTVATNIRHLEHPEIPYLDTSSLKSHKCIPGFHI